MNRGRFAMLLSAAAVCFAACSAPEAQAATRTLLVEAGKHARAHVPMSIELPKGVTKARLTDGGREVPCQVAEGKLWWILDELAAGAKKAYTAELGADSSAAPDAVALKQAEQTIAIAIDGKPFTTYHFMPEKIEGHQLRRPHFFPVHGPDQTAMTENIPRDHRHHTSIYVAYGAVNGVDNWSIGARAGWQLHTGFEAVASGTVVGMFRETLDWTTRDRKPVVAELRTVRVYRLPHTARMLDLQVTFLARYGRVVFGDTKEGGICSTRMRPEFRANNRGRLINAQGQSGGGAWGKRSEWVGCSGLVGGKRYGYAIFDTPGNLRHPSRWHARTYGLLTANPFGVRCFDRKSEEKGGHILQAGQQLTLRYRIYFHPGDEKEANVAARYADYAMPPRATWQ